MQQLIECVPNFSEGRDMHIIKQITDEIEAVEGVRLLNVDPGKATNRTVVTFVGSPEAVIEAAFHAIKKAGELIDMSKHKGEHPSGENSWPVVHAAKSRGERCPMQRTPAPACGIPS